MRISKMSSFVGGAVQRRQVREPCGGSRLMRVAELRPLNGQHLSPEVLFVRFGSLAPLDPTALHTDTAVLLDTSL